MSSNSQDSQDSQQSYQISADDVRRIREDYDKALNYQQSDPAACLITARRVAEDICKQLWKAEAPHIPAPRKGFSLYKLIDTLSKENVLPSPMKAPMIVLQNFGNVGAHAQERHIEYVTPEYAKPCLDSLYMVVTWYLECYQKVDPEAGVEIQPPTQIELPGRDVVVPPVRHKIPACIQEQYRQGNLHGTFKALTLFIDVSGFTTMARTLMQHGDEGAEVLAGLMNRIFTRLVDTVYIRGGFVSGFAGDAFTSIFPLNGDLTREQAILHALACLAELQAIFREEAVQPTKFGEFVLQFRAGVSSGEVEWGIVGDMKKMKKTKKTYYFRGAAIAGCATAGHCAPKGSMLFDERIAHVFGSLPQLEVSSWNTERTSDGFYRLFGIPQAVIQLCPPQRSPALLPIDTETLADFLPEQLIDGDEGGEFRPVLSIFINFDGITSHAELHAWAELLLEQTARFGGYLNQFDFGDKGSVAFCGFGAPRSFGRTLEYGLDCILSLQQAVTTSQELASLQFKAGISYDTAYVGFIGGNARCVYTYYGDVVNLAARMMEKAGWGEILVADSITKAEQTRRFDFSFKGNLEYKGIVESIPTYRLCGARDGYHHRFSGQMVGRQTQLEQLCERVSPIFEQGRFGGLIGIFGEAGTGKSRLAYELQKKLEQSKGQRELSWLLCPTEQIVRTSWNPFLSCLRHVFAQSAENSPADNQARFEEKHQELLHALEARAASETQATTVTNIRSVAAEFARTRPIFAAQLGLPQPGSLWDELDEKGRYENTEEAITSFFQAHALLEPLIIQLEDGQWLDTDSRTLLNKFTHTMQEYPVGIVITSRYQPDGSKPPLPGNDTDRFDLELDNLGRDDIRPYVESEIDKLKNEWEGKFKSELEGKPSEELLDIFMEKTTGNPFYIQQLTLYCVERGLMIVEKGELSLKKTTLRVPGTIKDLLLARLDLLSEQVRELINTASVVGQEFLLDLLSEILERDVDDLDGDAQDAARHRIFEQRIFEEIHRLMDYLYSFTHGLLRDTFYENQVTEKRRALHTLTAETIERLYRRRLKDFYEDLAYHYEQAEIRPKAIEYLQHAADRARSQYQNQRALNLYDRLLQQLQGVMGNTGQVIDALLHKAEILELIGKWKTCQQVCEDALLLAEQIDDARRMGEANRILGITCRQTVKYDRAIAYLEQALHLFEAVHEHNRIGDVLRSIGIVYHYQDDYERALSYYQQSLKKSTDVGDHTGIANNAMNIGVLYDQKGNFNEAMRWYQKSLTLYEQQGRKLGISKVLLNIGVNYESQGEYETALDYYQRALQAKEELGQKRGIARVLGNIGFLHKQQDVCGEALIYFDRAIAMGRDLADTHLLCECFIDKANALFSLQRYAEARDVNMEGLRIAENIDRKEYIFQGHILSAKLEFAVGNNHASSRLEEMLNQAEDDEERAALHYELWKMLHRERDRRTAIKLYQALYADTPLIDYKTRIEDMLKHSPPQA